MTSKSVEFVPRPRGRLSNPKRERYAVLRGTLNSKPSEALREAGYSESWIRSRGVNALESDPEVIERIEAIRREGISKELAVAMARPLSRLPELTERALEALADILDGKPTMVGDKTVYPSPATKLRAAGLILRTSETLLIASMPRDPRFRKTTILRVMKKYGLVEVHSEENADS